MLSHLTHCLLESQLNFTTWKNLKIKIDREVLEQASKIVKKEMNALYKNYLKEKEDKKKKKLEKKLKKQNKNQIKTK